MPAIRDARNRDDERTVVENLSKARDHAKTCHRWLLRDKLKAAWEAWEKDDYKAASRHVEDVHDQIQQLDRADKISRKMRAKYDALMDAVIAAVVPLERLAAQASEGEVA